MRSKSILGVVLAFAVASSLLTASGIAGTLGATPAGDQSARTLDDIASDATVDEDSETGGLSADVAGDNEPTLVGVAISGGQFAASLVASVA